MKSKKKSKSERIKLYARNTQKKRYVKKNKNNKTRKKQYGNGKPAKLTLEEKKQIYQEFKKLRKSVSKQKKITKKQSKTYEVKPTLPKPLTFKPNIKVSYSKVIDFVKAMGENPYVFDTESYNFIDITNFESELRKILDDRTDELYQEKYENYEKYRDYIIETFTDSPPDEDEIEIPPAPMQVQATTPILNLSNYYFLQEYKNYKESMVEEEDDAKDLKLLLNFYFETQSHLNYLNEIKNYEIEANQFELEIGRSRYAVVGGYRKEKTLIKKNKKTKKKKSKYNNRKLLTYKKQRGGSDAAAVATATYTFSNISSSKLRPEKPKKLTNIRELSNYPGEMEITFNQRNITDLFGETGEGEKIKNLFFELGKFINTEKNNEPEEEDKHDFKNGNENEELIHTFSDKGKGVEFDNKALFFPLDLSNKKDRKVWIPGLEDDKKDIIWENVSQGIEIRDSGSHKEGGMSRQFQTKPQNDVTLHFSQVLDPGSAGVPGKNDNYYYLLQQQFREIFEKRNVDVVIPPSEFSFLNLDITPETKMMCLFGCFLQGVLDSATGYGNREIRQEAVKLTTNVDPERNVNIITQYRINNNKLEFCIDKKDHCKYEAAQAPLANYINDLGASIGKRKPRTKKKYSDCFQYYMDVYVEKYPDDKKLLLKEQLALNYKWMGDKAQIYQALLFILFFNSKNKEDKKGDWQTGGADMHTDMNKLTPMDQDTSPPKVVIKTLDRLLFNSICRLIDGAENLSKKPDISGELKEYYKLIADNLGVVYCAQFDVANVFKKNINEGAEYTQCRKTMLNEWMSMNNLGATPDNLGMSLLYSNFGDTLKSAYRKIDDIKTEIEKPIKDLYLFQFTLLNKKVIEDELSQEINIQIPIITNSEGVESFIKFSDFSKDNSLVTDTVDYFEDKDNYKRDKIIKDLNTAYNELIKTQKYQIYLAYNKNYLHLQSYLYITGKIMENRNSVFHNNKLFFLPGIPLYVKIDYLVSGILFFGYPGLCGIYTEDIIDIISAHPISKTGSFPRCMISIKDNKYESRCPNSNKKPKNYFRLNPKGVIFDYFKYINDSLLNDEFIEFLINWREYYQGFNGDKFDKFINHYKKSIEQFRYMYEIYNQVLDPNIEEETYNGDYYHDMYGVFLGNIFKEYHTEAFILGVPIRYKIKNEETNKFYPGENTHPYFVSKKSQDETDKLISPELKYNNHIISDRHKYDDKTNTFQKIELYEYDLRHNESTNDLVLCLKNLRALYEEIVEILDTNILSFDLTQIINRRESEFINQEIKKELEIAFNNKNEAVESFQQEINDVNKKKLIDNLNGLYYVAFRNYINKAKHSLLGYTRTYRDKYDEKLKEAGAFILELYNEFISMCGNLFYQINEDVIPLLEATSIDLIEELNQAYQNLTKLVNTESVDYFISTVEDFLEIVDELLTGAKKTDSPLLNNEIPLKLQIIKEIKSSITEKINVILQVNSGYITVNPEFIEELDRQLIELPDNNNNDL